MVAVKSYTRTRHQPRIAGALLSFAVAGCGTPPPIRSITCADAAKPVITTHASEGMATTLKVLTYNIEGLAWPARTGRASQLAEIGKRISQMRASESGPDIILFQEMFSGPAKSAVAATGYPALVSGPRRTTRAVKSASGPLPGRRSIRRGEIGIRYTGGGLAIASRFPVINVAKRAYGSKACAGIDCLANKGILLARIAIPGVPTPIDIYNTHLNSQRASRVAVERHLAAHSRQALVASEFIDATHDDTMPVIFGGDFNMRHSEARWENFTRYQSLSLAHQVCANPASGCDVRMSWDGDEPWMDTQDLQFFWSGKTVSIRPIRVEAVFDGGPSGPQLSDHDGFMVTYQLRWPATSAAPGRCGSGSG